MKLQHLGVIFAIIIIPISFIISIYMQSQLDTIVLQTSYDKILNNATYDAIKAFQINENNSYYQQDITTEKIRDIEASITSFYNSLATGMGVSGYKEEELSPFVPALVYTLYDGYYIYTPYKDIQTSKYERGLKPFVYYSERYKNGNIDIIVNYSLDNYITIYGTDRSGEYHTRSGYLINPDDVEDDGTTLKYKQVIIKDESLSEITDGSYTNNEEEKYVYVTQNDQLRRREKAYKEVGTGKWYTYSTDRRKVYLEGDKRPETEKDTSAVSYYREARNFSKWVRDNFGSLKIIDIQTDQKEELGLLGPDKNEKIFYTSSDNDPEREDSVFHEHKRLVMKTSITTNLLTAIASYNEISQMDGTVYNFKMPILDETDWTKVLNNVSVISFLQGIPIKYKYYMGYSIITNNKNREFVDPKLFYFTDDGQDFHTMSHIENKDRIIAYRNIDFELRKIKDGNNMKYYYPHNKFGCYECIVAPTYENNRTENDLNNNGFIKKAYYTALGRERYNSFKSNRLYD